MKRILALTLTGLLAFGGAGALSATAAANGPQAPLQTEEAREAGNVYLVPGTYTVDGAKTENVIAAGAEKLTPEQCGEIYTDNAYICTLAEGEALPVPTSERVDKDGAPYTFNGWWTIVDATVTYFDKVPAATEATYLYADWRADLSQRRDPVMPDGDTTVLPKYYMSVKRAATNEEETLMLRVSGTDVGNADTLGYDRPVQLYNGWFELCPGDVITVYSAGLGGSDEVQAAPLDVSGRKITLESSGDGSNVTATYLTSSLAGVPSLTYRKSQKKRHFRIYIKFMSSGANMAVYLEPMD